MTLPELLSEWLGELNVSHTGGRFSPSIPGDATASLGVLTDWNYKGKGASIMEVIEEGPFRSRPLESKSRNYH